MQCLLCAYLHLISDNFCMLEKCTSIWLKTSLSKFGFKCIMNKHDFCDDSFCECLCHHAKTIGVELEELVGLEGN